MKKVLNAENPITDEQLRDLCTWLCENRTDSVVWFDLTMAFLFGTDEQTDMITRFVRQVIEERTRHPTAQVAPDGGRHEGGCGGADGRGNGDDSDGGDQDQGADDDDMQAGGDDVGHGNSGQDTGLLQLAGDSNLRLPTDRAPVKRFKKSATAASEHAAAGEPPAAAQAAQAAVQPVVAVSKETVSDWDFEKDLEQIFATGLCTGAGEAVGEAAAADKTRQGEGQAYLRFSKLSRHTILEIRREGGIERLVY